MVVPMLRNTMNAFTPARSARAIASRAASGVIFRSSSPTATGQAVRSSKFAAL